MTANNNFTVHHVVASLHSKGGGLPRAVVQITDFLAGFPDVSATLLSQCLVGDATLPSAAGVHRHVNVSASRIALAFGWPCRAELKRVVRDIRPALFHSHGIWSLVNHWTSIVARNNDIPLIIQPHGMLEPWALRHKLWKKKLAMAMFQRKDLDSALMFFATSTTEYTNLRELGFRQPVAIVPNGVVLDVAPAPVRCSSAERTRSVLFLSRVHPVKGLLNLVQAWAQLDTVGWRLCIAGPDEAGHLKEVLELVNALGLNNSIEYVGEVDGRAKSDLYNAADLFVLPTLTENFGVVVAEALAHGLPVITTRGAPWADLATLGCGWWVDIGVEPLVQALREAMALGDDERWMMGARSRVYVRRYDLNGIVERTIEVYRWALGQGLKPSCVELN